MDGFLRDARYQFIDDCGRLRMLKYDRVCLFTPPLHPLSKKHVIPARDIDDLINRNGLPSYRDAVEFVLEYNFDVSFSHPISDDEIDGLWLTLEGVSDFYIPIQVTKRKDVELKNDEPPLWIIQNPHEGFTSDIADVVSNVLEQTSVRFFALHNRLTPKDFHEDPDFVVNLSRRLNDASLPMFLSIVEDNDLLYSSSGKVRIPKVTDERLKNELIESLINSSSLVSDDKIALSEYAQREIIIGKYRTVSGFRKSPDFCIFENREDIDTYEMYTSGKERVIREKVDMYSVEPYPFSDPRITHNNIALIQNVIGGDYTIAARVVLSWKKSRYNPGYFGVGSDESITQGELRDIPFNVVLLHGESSPSGLPDLIQYSESSYAAILYLN